MRLSPDSTDFGHSWWIALALRRSLRKLTLQSDGINDDRAKERMTRFRG